METFTLSTMITSIGTLVTGAVGWVGDIAGVIAAEPLLLFGFLFGFVGTAIVVFKKLVRA